MLEVVDQMGALVRLEKPAKRIVSLVPSITHLLHALSLEQEVIGITKFCVHPEAWFHTKTRIGGTKDPKLDLIESLAPDLVVANKEENLEEHVNSLKKRIPVYVSDISEPFHVLQLLHDLGLLADRQIAAQALAKTLSDELLDTAPLPLTKSVLYFIWRKPWMVAGTDTYIHALLERCGVKNIAPGNRYPTLTDEMIQVLNPELVLLSSEPYPFSDKHVTELHALLPTAQIELVNGEIFSWYGPFLLDFLHQRKSFMKKWSTG